MTDRKQGNARSLPMRWGFTASPELMNVRCREHHEDRGIVSVAIKRKEVPTLKSRLLE
jgi:hypothetical protein